MVPQSSQFNRTSGMDVMFKPQTRYAATTDTMQNIQVTLL